MAIFDIGLQRLSVDRSAGRGTPIVLVHAHCLSSQAFAQQVNSPLGERNLLVTLDLPGHGRSSRSDDDDAYTLGWYARIVTSAVRLLRLEDALFVGWGLGGQVLLDAIDDLPKARGLMLVGAAPIGSPASLARAYLPDSSLALAFKAEVSAQEARRYASALLRPGAPKPPSWFERQILATDARVRVNLGWSLRSRAGRDQSEILARAGVPLAMVLGQHDQQVSLPYLESLRTPTLWRNRVQRIAGAGNAPHWEQPERFNALLEAFAQDCAAVRDPGQAAAVAA